MVTRPAAAKLLAALRQHYQPGLQRDPDLEQLLDSVAETYFGVRRQSPGGMMGGLMQMLAGGGGGMQLTG